jgi:hypothetical protein
MDILTRALRAFAGLLTVFAGYFLMAAEGWGEPLDHMFVERLLIGGLMIVIGFWFILSAVLSPSPRPMLDDASRSDRAAPPAGGIDSTAAQGPSRLIVHPLSRTTGRLSLAQTAEPAGPEGEETPGMLAARALLMVAEGCDPQTAPTHAQS